MRKKQESKAEFGEFLRSDGYRSSTALQYQSVANSYEQWRLENVARRNSASMRRYLEAIPSLPSLRRAAAALGAYQSFLIASGIQTASILPSALSPTEIWQPSTLITARALLAKSGLSPVATWADVVSRAARSRPTSSARENLAQFAQRALPLRRTIYLSLHFWHKAVLATVDQKGTPSSPAVRPTGRAHSAGGKSDVRIRGRQL